MSIVSSDTDRIAFAQRIGYTFHDLSLLERALTHRSFQREHNERLEFLGDAVLELVISSELFHRYPHLPEGALTRMRAHMVERSGLLMTAQHWRLAPLLRISKGECGANGLPRADSVVANGVEAVIGAVYLDGGYDCAQKVIKQAWQCRLDDALHMPVVDAKTALQEWTQQRSMGLPVYRCDDRGAGVSPRFRAFCQVGEKLWGEGVGGRKKDAERKAAEVAMKALLKQEAADDGES